MDLFHSVEESNSHILGEQTSDPFVQSARRLLLHALFFFAALTPAFGALTQYASHRTTLLAFSQSVTVLLMERMAGDIGNTTFFFSGKLNFPRF